MKPRHIFPIILSIIMVYTFVGCDRPNRVELLKYKNSILEDRQKKDKFFKFSPDSPIPDTERWQFTNLKYYPVNYAYKVKAEFNKAETLSELTMQTSTGQERVYVRIGTLDFNLMGQDYSLNTYQEKAWILKGEQRLVFVPFTDQTSGASTYGAGRYLDLEIFQEKQEVNLDFNMAYNPYCAYTSGYSCPVPPPENHLAVKVEAGEKNYKEF